MEMRTGNHCSHALVWVKSLQVPLVQIPPARSVMVTHAFTGVPSGFGMVRHLTRRLHRRRRFGWR